MEHEEPGLPQIIGHIAAVIGNSHFPTGERAGLSRINPGQPPPLTFYRFAVRHLPPGWDRNDETRRDWMTIVGGIALMSPNAHRVDQGLGQTLATVRFSEARMERLLASPKDTRRTLILRTARLLSAKGAACNWVTMASLLFKSASDLDDLNRRVATAFYQTILSSR